MEEGEACETFSNGKCSRKEITSSAVGREGRSCFRSLVESLSEDHACPASALTPALLSPPDRPPGLRWFVSCGDTSKMTLKSALQPWGVGWVGCAQDADEAR